MKLGKYSFGIGDRFSRQGESLLRAIVKAKAQGVEVTPVWNKSNREHDIVGSEPLSTRAGADAAVKALGWEGAHFVDADHVNFKSVDRFIQHSDFFTLDVANNIGGKSTEQEIAAFKKSCKTLGSEVHIPGLAQPIAISDGVLGSVAQKYLAAVKEAGKIYAHIESVKGKGNFITEVSMDEVESPQTPIDMFFILKMIADKGIPVDTIAPKFSGRFNKGVDYEGEVAQFAREFEEDIFVIDYAEKHFGLPADLKLSIHSGSDKFAIYPAMGKLIKKHNKGLHVKTAGTTWLEEVIGLSISGPEGLKMAKAIYAGAHKRKDELCGPYADVIDIDESLLPKPGEVETWSGQKFSDTLRHIPGCADYNPNFRQLIHVGYKIAAEMGDAYTHLLENNAEVVGKCVEENIYERHLKRLFDL